MEEVPPLPDDILDLGRRLIPSPVFVVGCARSGTSIFGEALASHPDVTYLFELSPMWDKLIGEREDHRLDASHATPELAPRVYRALADEAAGTGHGGAVLVEKNPKHVLRLPFLDALFPWARFVHVLRDGRDVVASLMFRNRGTRWGHLKVPGWRDLLAQHPFDNHVRCAHQWRDAVATARRDGRRRGERYLEVAYEDLVRDPAAVVPRALAFIGLAVTPEVRAFWPKIADETAGSYHARRQVRHYVENHRRRVGRFRENLSGEQVAAVEAVCGELLRELGYPLTSPHFPSG
jgi:hypothetical protein